MGDVKLAWWERPLAYWVRRHPAAGERIQLALDTAGDKELDRRLDRAIFDVGFWALAAITAWMGTAIMAVIEACTRWVGATLALAIAAGLLTAICVCYVPTLLRVQGDIRRERESRKPRGVKR